jgi:hypothetical protein
MRIRRIRIGRSRRLRIVVAIVLGLLVATAVNALVASNTVPGTAAGSGAGTISGYTVTNVAYNLNSTNPANIDSVSFTLDASATTVRIKLDSASSTYYPAANCTPSGNNWTCTTILPSQATVAGANQLSVVSVA